MAGYKFAEVWCSQCGRSFGPGDNGFSHCSDHAPAVPPSADIPKTLRTVYLGDGLYASFDGFQLRLYASDGISETNEVFLDSDTLASLLQFVEFIKEKRR